MLQMLEMLLCCMFGQNICELLTSIVAGVALVLALLVASCMLLALLSIVLSVLEFLQVLYIKSLFILAE